MGTSSMHINYEKFLTFNVQPPDKNFRLLTGWLEVAANYNHSHLRIKHL
jgi:hypothetical protein